MMSLGGLAQVVTKPWELEINERILTDQKLISLVQFRCSLA